MDYVRMTQTADRLARLLPLACDRLNRMVCRVEQTTGLSGIQLQLLEYVFRNGESSITTLRRALGRAQSSVSELTDRLEQKGLVRRTPADDRRKSLVELTVRGRKWMRTRDQQQREALALQLAELTERDRELLLESIGEFLALTDRVRRPPPVVSGRGAHRHGSTRMSSYQ